MSSDSIGLKQSDTKSSEAAAAAARQTRRARDKPTSQTQQTTAPASPVMSGSGGGSGSNRKRRLDEPAPESVTAADLDTDSSSGDGSSTSLQSAQPKISRTSTDGGGGGVGVGGGGVGGGGGVMAVSTSPDTGEAGTMLGRLGADREAGSILRFGLGDQQPQPVPHRYVVNISETTLLPPHRARSDSTLAESRLSGSTTSGLDGGVASAGGGAAATTGGGGANGTGGGATGGGGGGAGGGGASKRKSLAFRFDCELGDMWIENNFERSRRPHRRIVTGNTTTEKVIESLELQGYAVLSQLARGKFAVVLAAHSVELQKNVAMKMLDREVHPRSSSQTKSQGRSSSSSISIQFDLPGEIPIQRQLKHRNVVELFDYHVINNRVTMVMEFCENGSLRHLLTTTPGCILSEPICRRYFRDMFESVAYLHSQGIVHCDIKCENFLLDRHNRVKLADFASARRHVLGDELCTTRHGTAGYWSPEVVARLPYNPRTADVWALGVTLHILLTSKFPFSGDDRQVLVGMQRGLDLRKESSVRLSREVSDLLKGLLHYVLQVRYTINRVRCSDWFRLSDGDKPYIGNFYLVAKPRKAKDSPQEQALKQSFGI